MSESSQCWGRTFNERGRRTQSCSPFLLSFLFPSPHTFHKNKNLWTTSFFFHGPDTVELIIIWCSSLSINIFQASLKNSSLQIYIQLIPHPHAYVGVCVCACACVRACVRYSAVHFCVYLLVLCIRAQIRIWSCLITDNFGLFTEIAVSKFLYGLAVVRQETFLFCPLFIHFSASFLRHIVP